MAAYFVGILNLFDGIIRGLYTIPIFAFFLSGFLAFAGLGLFLFLRNAVGSGRK